MAPGAQLRARPEGCAHVTRCSIEGKRRNNREGGQESHTKSSSRQETSAAHFPGDHGGQWGGAHQESSKALLCRRQSHGSGRTESSVFAQGYTTACLGINGRDLFTKTRKARGTKCLFWGLYPCLSVGHWLDTEEEVKMNNIVSVYLRHRQSRLPLCFMTVNSSSFIQMMFLEHAP